MKRKKKRYSTAGQIISEVDEYRAKRQALILQAQNLDTLADQFAKKNAATDAEWHRKEADRIRAKAARILEVRLPYLKRKLAEFQTGQLPGLDNGDRSIQA
jgi:hypothetical protein